MVEERFLAVMDKVVGNTRYRCFCNGFHYISKQFSSINISHAAITTAIAFGDWLCPHLIKLIEQRKLMPFSWSILKGKLGMCLVLH
jgi:hypothetical protein